MPQLRYTRASCAATARLSYVLHGEGAHALLALLTINTYRGIIRMLVQAIFLVCYKHTLLLNVPLFVSAKLRDTVYQVHVCTVYI